MALSIKSIKKSIGQISWSISFLFLDPCKQSSLGIRMEISPIRSHLQRDLSKSDKKFQISDVESEVIFWNTPHPFHSLLLRNPVIYVRTLTFKKSANAVRKRFLWIFGNHNVFLPSLPTTTHLSPKATLTQQHIALSSDRIEDICVALREKSRFKSNPATFSPYKEPILQRFFHTSTKFDDKQILLETECQKRNYQSRINLRVIQSYQTCVFFSHYFDDNSIQSVFRVCNTNDSSKNQERKREESRQEKQKWVSVLENSTFFPNFQSLSQ